MRYHIEDVSPVPTGTDINVKNLFCPIDKIGFLHGAVPVVKSEPMGEAVTSSRDVVFALLSLAPVVPPFPSSHVGGEGSPLRSVLVYISTRAHAYGISPRLFLRRKNPRPRRKIPRPSFPTRLLRILLRQRFHRARTTKKGGRHQTSAP